MAMKQWKVWKVVRFASGRYMSLGGGADLTKFPVIEYKLGGTTEAPDKTPLFIEPTLERATALRAIFSREVPSASFRILYGTAYDVRILPRHLVPCFYLKFPEDWLSRFKEPGEKDTELEPFFICRAFTPLEEVNFLEGVEGS